MIQLPPWLQAADPAAQTAQGLQIGMRMGAEQAAQRFQESQQARQTELDAQSQARWQAEFGLQAQAAAKKYQAMQDYQKRVASGEDPLKVLMEVGPAAGIGGAAQAAAIRSSYSQPKPTRTVTLPQVNFADVGGRKIPYLVDMMTGRGTWAPSGALDTEKPGQLTEVQRQQLIDLRREGAALTKKWQDPLNVKMAKTDKTLGDAMTTDTARLKDIQAQIAKIEGLDEGGDGEAPPGSTPAAAPPGSPSPVRIVAIRPKGQAAAPTEMPPDESGEGAPDPDASPDPDNPPEE